MSLEVSRSPTRSAVLFLVFNRPDTTARVFEAIRLARPPRLYVAADGVRSGRAGERERCDEVRRVASAVDWPCELMTLFRNENLGCKRAVSTAITWFFEHEAEGIILEDDCLPDPSFFPYCDELLERYRSEPRVMCISGDNFVSGVWKPQDSYYFSKYVHIWGWASWRRAWELYDVEMRDWRRGAGDDLLKRVLPDEREARAYWRDVFDRVAAASIDTWDYQWAYACWKYGGLSCLPAVNLISNIGFGEGATHTVDPGDKNSQLPAGSLETPLVHPAEVTASTFPDRWTSQHVLRIDEQIGPWARLRRVVARSLRRIRTRPRS